MGVTHGGSDPQLRSEPPCALLTAGPALPRELQGLVWRAGQTHFLSVLSGQAAHTMYIIALYEIVSLSNASLMQEL